MGASHTHRMRVAYGDCDPSGVVFNPNYLVFYDVALTGPPEIIAALHEWGYLRDRVRQPTTGVPGGRIAALVLRTTTEFALQRLITSLI